MFPRPRAIAPSRPAPPLLQHVFQACAPPNRPARPRARRGSKPLRRSNRKDMAHHEGPSEFRDLTPSE